MRSSISGSSGFGCKTLEAREGAGVDARGEDDDYSKHVKAPDFSAVGRGYVEEYRRFKTDDAVDTLPSLKATHKETRRLQV